MDDIVAIKVQCNKKKKYYLLTWGRIFDPVDSKKLLEVVSKNLEQFGTWEIEVVKLCDELREASNEKYFYEAFFAMCQKKIPYGKSYNSWCKKIKKELLKGKEMYFLG